MIDIAITVATHMISIALLLCLWRAVLGPSLMDRVLAIDTMVVNIIGLVFLFGMQQNSKIYFEAALLLAMFGFVSTVAYCRFALRGNIIE